MKPGSSTATRALAVAATALLPCAVCVESAAAATYSELSAMQGAPPPGLYPQKPFAAGPYSSPPGVGACPQCAPTPYYGGPQGVSPAALDAPGAASLPSSRTSPRPNLPLGPEADLPNGRLQVWSFGQVNSTTDPFNSSGLSTPFMFVPWSTPLSGWTNAQTWNWWRERAGVQPPYW